MFELADTCLALQQSSSSWQQSAIFAATFALSFSLLELVIFEILDTFSREFRHSAWRLELQTTMVLLVGVLPFSFCLQLTGGVQSRQWLSRSAITATAKLCEVKHAFACL